MELVLLAVVALVVFGPKKLPEMGRQLGKGMRSFKESMSGMTESFNSDSDEPARVAVTVAADPQAARSRDDL
jgi:sec-independent protein translocase protein TatA